MDQQKIDLFIMTNKKYLPAEKLVYLKDKLLNLSDDKVTLISTIEFKDPTTILSGNRQIYDRRYGDRDSEIADSRRMRDYDNR